ncbi:MAG: glycosyltransferase [Devosiaceae bacterium]|nr:glycosyltransferase [Devosiaceae bacterium MH13]
MALAPFVPVRHADGRVATLYADSARARSLKQSLEARAPEASEIIQIAPQGHVQALWAELLAASLSDFATNWLATRSPLMSARETLAAWQRWFLLGLLASLALWAWLDLASLFVAGGIVFSCLYLLLAGARLAAIAHGSHRGESDAARVPDRDLAAFSVLVAVHDEAAVMRQLVGALRDLDYPPSKLDIMILCEADDRPTLAALEQITLPDHVAVISVPPGLPRTKPKALNFGLPLTRGRFVTVYDAEDRPEPDQLRRAVAAHLEREQAIAAGAELRPLACVQAALHVTNRGEGFFAKHFRLEYMALFDAFLPALSKLRLPIPLGGTSNHFCRKALIEAGGWDPYNVTEDADLGIRLARLGYDTAVIRSTTFEEAPTRFGPWVRQRARWFKGWWQTWFVHMREPGRLADELGLAGFVAFQTVLFGVLVSMLVHPLFLAATFATVFSMTQAAPQEAGIEVLVRTLGAFNLVLGYAAAAALSWVGASERDQRGVIALLLQIPIYWLLLSAAGYLAVWDLIRRPHHWHKTPHKAVAPDFEPELESQGAFADGFQPTLAE